MKIFIITLLAALTLSCVASNPYQYSNEPDDIATVSVALCDIHGRALMKAAAALEQSGKCTPEAHTAPDCTAAVGIATVVEEAGPACQVLATAVEAFWTQRALGGDTTQALADIAAAQDAGKTAADSLKAASNGGVR
jgi:hypothetical protein